MKDNNRTKELENDNKDLNYKIREQQQEIMQKNNEIVFLKNELDQRKQIIDQLNKCTDEVNKRYEDQCVNNASLLKVNTQQEANMMRMSSKLPTIIESTNEFERAVNRSEHSQSNKKKQKSATRHHESKIEIADKLSMGIGTRNSQFESGRQSRMNSSRAMESPYFKDQNDMYSDDIFKELTFNDIEHKNDFLKSNLIPENVIFENEHYKLICLATFTLIDQFSLGALKLACRFISKLPRPMFDISIELGGDKNMKCFSQPEDLQWHTIDSGGCLEFFLLFSIKQIPYKIASAIVQYKTGDTNHKVINPLPL